MHLGTSDTLTSIGTLKWTCLRQKLESSLGEAPSSQHRKDPAARH